MSEHEHLLRTIRRRVINRLAFVWPANVSIAINPMPLCSFTFDDCPRSALNTGGKMLEQAGAGGTFFIASTMGQNAATNGSDSMWGEDIIRARASGHEIACHTYSHLHLSDHGAREIERDLDANLAALRTIVPDIDLVSFAYPFGEVSFAAKRIVARRFGCGRTIRPGLNGRFIDVAALRSFGIESRQFDENLIERIVRRASTRRAWIVFTTHDVADEPSEWGCTPREFKVVLSTVQKVGIEILPMRAALDRIMRRKAE